MRSWGEFVFSSHSLEVTACALNFHSVLHTVYLVFSVFLGPGSYEPRIKSDKGNMLTVRAPRDKPLKEGTPGPGYYDVSSSVLVNIFSEIL